MKLCALLVALGFSQVAFAMADSAEVRKVKYERRWFGRYELTLEVVRADEHLWGCRKLTIHGRYSFSRWKVRVRAPSSPTWAGHNVALARLETADVPFFLLVVGEGLSPIGECVFVSDGLISYYTDNGRFSVMSFYRSS
jgi:hypothetical protein